MSKLTTERCRQLISQLSFERDNHGMSNQKYDYLEALEIALPVLEQQEKGDDGWIEWGGGRPPVKPDVMVCVRYRKGKEKEPDTAGHYYWNHTNSPVDIVAYRVIENDGREG